MPVRMTREGRAETREAKRTEQDNQKSKSGKTAGFSSTSQKGNIVHGKLKSQKELKKITGSEDYKKSDYEGKTKMLNVATAKKGLASRTHGSDKPNKEIGKQSFKKNFSFSGKQMSDHYKARKSRTQSVSRMNPVPYLTGGQAKIAAKAPPPNKIDAKDFAVLRAEKAKGRGMGLQDEKVKPGKVIKAKRGTGILAEKGTSKNFAGYTKVFEGPRDKGRVATISGVKPKIKKSRKTYKSMDEMRKAKGFKPGETASQFNKRRMMLAGAKEAAKATRIGKIVLPIAAAGVAAQQYLKSKMKKKDKKMGGGMMKKYRSGGPVPVEKIKKAFPEASPGKVSRMQTMLGDKSAPMKKERLFEGDRGRRKELIKKLRGVAKATPLGLGIKAVETAKKLKEKMSKKMGGGMMKRPMGYVSGGAPGPAQGKLDRFTGRKRPRRAGQLRKAAGRKEDSSVTLGKFMKSKVDALNESVAAGGMKRERVTEGSTMRRKQDFIKDVAAGKYKTPNKDAAYYKSIGLTGERGDRAVKDFFTPKMKVGGTVKAKCKLGRNKPTKMY